MLASALMAAGLVAVIVHAEGAAGLKPFLNLEALAVVAAGALVAARPWQPRAEEERLRDAAQGAMAGGLLGTILGLMLMLASIDDVSAIPRRMALALCSAFLGLFLSEFLLIPLAGGRAAGPNGDRRAGFAALSLCLALSALFAALYALSAALNSR